MNIVFIIIGIMYLGMLIFPGKRVYFALAGALGMVLSGTVPLNSILHVINWNVIMMLVGTMGIVHLFIQSGMPALLADIILSKSPSVCMAIIALAAFAGMISAFVDNVATVLMIAPVGLAVCKKQQINPVPVIIAIAVSSNLQGAATLVGDTTSILLGSYTDMSFWDFIWWKGKPSIFFTVELGALGTLFVLLWLFRGLKQKVAVSTKTEVSDYIPTLLLLFVIAGLIIASFFRLPYVDDYKNGLICLIICVFGLLQKSIREKSISSIRHFVCNLEYETLGMLLGLFIVIAGLTNTGIIDTIAQKFAGIGSHNLLMLYTVLVFSSVLLSAFIDNIPYVASMLPVVESIASNLVIEPTLLYFGLLLGATLGGNLTPFGASANVAGIGILRKEGYVVKMVDFAKIGIPFTFIAVLLGYLVNWVVWH